jgi:hypothetical protein
VPGCSAHHTQLLLHGTLQQRLTPLLLLLLLLLFGTCCRACCWRAVCGLLLLGLARRRWRSGWPQSSLNLLLLLLLQ